MTRIENWRRVEEVTRPRADTLARVARVAAEAGQIDAIELLGMLRSAAQGHLDALTAESALYAAWSALELACGSPLLRFPDEPEAPTEPVPGPMTRENQQ